MAKVTVLDIDGVETSYSTYLAARTDIISSSIQRPLIQIWANLNEQIVLLTGADIWIAPGVVIDHDPSNPGVTITDNNQAVECKIYGYGVIKNSHSSATNFACNFTSTSSKISIDCDHIESNATCISSSAAQFQLTCYEIMGNKNGAIYLNNNSSEININLIKIITGLESNSDTGTTAIISRGNGFLKTDEVNCLNDGHCLSHRGGIVTARIKKFTNKMNRNNAIANVHLDQGTGTQKLILYFDEILNFSGIYNSGIGIHLHEGTGIFIGRKVYSEIEVGIDISGNNTRGYVKCDEIISLNKEALRLFSINIQITVESNYIEGIGFSGCVYLQDDSSLILKNAKLVNKAITSDSKCIVLEKVDTLLPRLELNNIKAVTGNTTSGSVIFLAGFTEVAVKNYGLFTNKELVSGITLEVGDLSNFLIIVSTDLD